MIRRLPTRLLTMVLVIKTLLAQFRLNFVSNFDNKNIIVHVSTIMQHRAT